MTCRRCGGLMIVEPMYHAAKSNASEGHHEARCLNCGNIEDGVIYTNRLDPPPTGTGPRHNIVVEVESGWERERHRRKKDRKPAATTRLVH